MSFEPAQLRNAPVRLVVREYALLGQRACAGPLTLVASFVTGFFGGNGLPYYFAGSIGEGQNPSPFRDGATVNVVIGCGALLIAAASAMFIDWSGHGTASFAGLWLGVVSCTAAQSRPTGIGVSVGRSAQDREDVPA